MRGACLPKGVGDVLRGKGTRILSIRRMLGDAQKVQRHGRTIAWNMMLITGNGKSYVQLEGSKYFSTFGHP